MSIRARIMRFLSKQAFKAVNADSDVQFVRASFEKTEGRRRAARGVAESNTEIAGVACKWLVPKGCENAPVLYYLHGGAYLMGSSNTHRRMVSHIAKQAGVRALLPDYALAPEQPFPAGLIDCVAVYRALVGSGISADQIIIAGDSAGGGMSMATLLSLRDAGDKMPAAAVLLSPWIDLSAQGESMVTRADDDPWFKPDEMKEVARYYYPEGPLDNPLVSPVFGSADNLPATLIQVGDHEILLSDSTRLADNISKEGGSVVLQIWPEMWHVFQFFIGQMPESKKAIADIALFVRGELGITH
jgi:acetyl esterase/lipase